jgi:hypothetical protein
MFQKFTASLKAQISKKYVSNFGIFSKKNENMLPSAFGYVEGAGLFYGMSLIARTLYRVIYIV